MPQIIPAILTNNVDVCKNKLSVLEKIVSRVQIDIIDGKFAKNNTVNPKEIVQLKTSLFLEAHLMTCDPEKYIGDCAKASIKLITVHLEACRDNINNILDEIHSFGIETGVAINPETPIELIKPFEDKVDLVLIMSVHPGFNGQEFILPTLKKIKKTRKLLPNTRIEVDGGINLKNIKKITEAGADYLVIGSSLFKNGIDEMSVRKTIEELSKEIAN